MIEGMLGIDNAPRHRRRTGAVLFHETPRVAAWLVVDHVSDVALLPKLDRLGLVRRRMDVTHPGEEGSQLLGLGMGELHEFEPVRAGWVLRSDR